MDALAAHAITGIFFVAEGLWHLINHIKLHLHKRKDYKSLPWFPTPKIRYLELYVIMVGTSMFIVRQLFINKARHRPFDPDGSIPTSHLPHFEHALLAMSFFVYAVFAIIIDRRVGHDYGAMNGLTLLLAAFGYSQELLIFHLHSADHVGVEGQYHFLFQLVVLVSLATALLGIGYPRSFFVSFVRSFSLLFQGIWLMVTGVMLWTPAFTPKGCFYNSEGGPKMVVRCHTQEDVKRARALANIEFSWYLILAISFSMCLYLLLEKTYRDSSEYQTLSEHEVQEDDSKDVEAPKVSEVGGSKHFVSLGEDYPTKSPQTILEFVK